MEFLFSGVNWLIVFGNSLFSMAEKYPLYGLVVVSVAFLVIWKRDFSRASSFLLSQSGYTVIDGKFSKGKTRFLTLVSGEARKRGMFVLCNFYNEHEDIRWNSKADLIRMMRDLWLLGEAQNYSEADISKMYETEGKGRVREKVRAVKAIRKKYPNIPFNGFHTKFFIAGDEMQNIFFNRDSMENFKGENKPLLKLLHQIRHFNAQGMFALTDAGEFDKKFRRISSYYVAFKDVANDLFIGYDVFSFETDREHNFDLEMAQKLTKTTVWKVNGYVANRIIQKLESALKRKINFRFRELGFFSKFNCDPDVDIYEEGHLLRYLDKWYEAHPDFKRYEFSN